MRKKILSALVLVVVVGGGCVLAYQFHLVPGFQGAAVAAVYKTPEEKNDVYVRFLMEAYDTIETNYWQQTPDATFANLFQLSLQKAAATTTTATATDRASTAAMLEGAFSAMKDDDAKKQLALGTLQVVLYNLAPNGRSELLSDAQQQQEQREVDNVHPATNLYSELGVTASSTNQQIAQAYAQEKTELEASSSPQAQQDLARATYIDDVLSNPATKTRYDATQQEPTVFGHVIGSTLYIDIGQMSPTTAADFQNALSDASTTPLSSLIIDVRGNIGGSLDQVPGILGLFLGNNQYAFDLFAQGNLNPIRTTLPQFPGISRYRDVAVLTDRMSQSSAEELTASLQRYHLATVVGATTRGWGTVEQTYQLNTTIDASTTYGMLLVHAITLREDNTPIEGTGVTPDVSISDKNWKAELPQYFRSQSIISAIEQTIANPPLQ